MIQDWPLEGKPADFEDLCKPVATAIRKAYKLTPRDYGERIKWKGPSLPRDMMASSLSFEEALTRKHLEYSKNEQGRDLLTTIIGLAVQLGIEQGRRLQIQDQRPAILTIKGGIALLDATRGEDSP